MKKRILSILFILQACIASLAVCQDSLVRESRPFTVKAGSEGLGMDFSIGNYFAVDFTTFAFYHSLKSRIFLFDRNASPYLGVGVGSFKGIMSESQANKWFSFQLGWEHSYEVVQIQIYYQRPISINNVNSKAPFFVNLSVGMRVLY